MNGRKAAALAVGVGAASAVAIARARARRRREVPEPEIVVEPAVEPAGESLQVRSVDGAILDALVCGEPDAPTVVLAHCWMGDRTMWAEVARGLVDRGRRVVLWDHRGHRASETGEDGYTLEAIAADLESVMVAADARDAVVAGHSMGGMATQIAVGTRPEVLARTAAVALVATACDPASLTQVRAIDRLLLRGSDKNVATRLMASAVGPSLHRGAFGRSVTKAQLRASSSAFVTTHPRARRHFAEAMAAMDLTPHLPGIERFTAVVVGDRDRITPPARAASLVSNLPNASLVTLPGRGHMLPLEAPEVLIDLIDQLVIDRQLAGRFTQGATTCSA
jgi:pimeloyl-ACP methyl ester carboxylesterase